MTALDINELVSFLEKTKFATVTATTGGNNVLSSDVSEDRVLIPVALILSETSGGANTADITKVEEDDTTTDIHPNFNLGPNESVVLTIEDKGAVLPRLEGGTNLQITAGTNNIEVTLIFVENVEV